MLRRRPFAAILRGHDGRRPPIPPPRSGPRASPPGG